MKRNYRATFVLDMRRTQDSVEQVVEALRTTIGEVNGTVTEVQNLGIKNFVRPPARDFIQGCYVCLPFETEDPLAPQALGEKVRLNPNVNRVMVEKQRV
ncbi:MAG: 30S ribosomal protein S6 [Puniceicoccales bacterium]|jgi:ribosomal protein S6|nr:30S ribosomal protein S6 [Puniceicoccales bacterium]